MGDEAITMRETDVLMGAALLSAGLYAASSLLALMALAVLVLSAGGPGGSEWMFYVQFKEADGSSQTLWYKDPDKYDDQGARGVVKGTLPLEMYVNTDAP